MFKSIYIERVFYCYPVETTNAVEFSGELLLFAPNKLYEYFGFVVDVLKYCAKFSKLYGLFVVEAKRFRYTSNTGFRVYDDCRLTVGLFVVVVVNRVDEGVEK
jgi:hypothetical protein